MNNSRNQKIAAAFDRLFRTYPPLGQGSSAEDVTRDRIDRAQVYFEAVETYDLRDIEAAVQSFLSGAAPGHNPSFAPPAPMVAAETRRLMNIRLDSESRARKPALPPPDIHKTDESRTRVKAMVAQVVADTAARLRTADADKLKQAQSWNDRLDARFMPDQAPDAMRRRLGFSAGDAHGDRDVA